MSEKSNIENLINNKGVQFRDFRISNIEIREATEDEPEKLIIQGVPVVYGQETILYDGQNYQDIEVIAPGALNDADMTDVILNMNHCGRVYARTRNGSLKLVIRDDGLHMEAELWADDEGHMELYRDIKRGNLDRMSFAFTVADQDWSYEEREDEKNRYIRTIRGIKKVYDVSCVDIPAYDGTSLSARKAFDAVREERAAASREAARLEAMKDKLKLKLKLMEV